MGQMANLLIERQRGALPSNSEAKPRPLISGFLVLCGEGGLRSDEVLHRGKGGLRSGKLVTLCAVAFLSVLLLLYFSIF